MRLLKTTVHLSMLAALLALVWPVETLYTTSLRAAPSGGKESPFGVVANLGNRVRTDEQPAMVALMREACVQWAREELSWDKVQPERGGPFQWGGDAAGMYNYDNAITLQRNAGIQVLGLLDYNPAWFKGKNPVLDEWIGDWGNYVYNAVARYGRDGKQIRYWEVWNEPNLRPFGYEHGLYTIDEFVRVLVVARAAIKAADPNAVVVLGGLSDIYGELPTPQDYDSLDYLRMIDDAGGWSAFDILGWHPYRGTPPEDISDRRGVQMSLEGELTTLDRMLAEFGPKPVWLTEMGWSSAARPGGIDEAAQAAYLQRMYVMALTHPSVQKIFWYDLRDDTDPRAPYEQPVANPAEAQYHFGLLQRRFPLDPAAPALRKPSFLAYRALTDMLGGLQPQGMLADGVRAELPGVFWYRFGDGARRVDVLWRVGETPIEVELRCDCREGRVRAWDGGLRTVTMANQGRLVGRLEEVGTPMMIETGPDRQQQGTFFPQTGHALDAPFADYWRKEGGLEQFGYPITGPIFEPDPGNGQARLVQYFERNRLDYFPELAKTAYTIQIGRLGDLFLRREGVDWTTLPRRETGDQPCLYFPETKRQLCPPFRERWEQAGGLARHGLPLTDAFEEGGRLVQYFERSRFEWHPENPPAFQVQLGLLSRELYGSWGRWR